MTETNTLTSLRRAVASKLRMPFYRRIGQSSTLTAASTTTTFKDTKLTQTDGFWNQHWFFAPSTGEVSLIRSFRADTDTAYLETPLATSLNSGTTYEIHSIWNANEIREALNTAIRVARRSFPENVTSIYGVVQEDVVTYTLSSLTKVPWIINKVWVEQRTNVRQGAVLTATVTSATLDTDLTNVTSNWVITIYEGTGKGQYRSVTGVSGSDVNVATWTVIPDNTSKYSLFDASEEMVAWKLFSDLRYDAPEFPTVMYFNRTRPEDYGMRIRLEYTAISAELTTESSTTNVPREFLLAKACSELHSQALSSTKADKETHYGEYKRLSDEADQYLIRNAIHTPGTVLLNPDPSEYPFSTENADPLGWRR